jgi:hypothetical protein
MQTKASPDSATVAGGANVAEADVLIPGAFPFFTATEGTAVSGLLATFNDTGYPGNTASDFTATIDWGDGTSPDAGTVSGSGGFFAVSGSHTYADEGNFTVKVTLTDDDPGTASATATGMANVADADIMFGGGSLITATEGNSFSGQAASFIDVGYPNNSPSDFTATIDWGDGTTDAGTVSASNGIFRVSGTHTYADEGSFTTTITVTDDAPGTASATFTLVSGLAAIAEGDTLSPVSIASGNIPEGVSFGGTAAVFSDTNTAADPSDFMATIDWGDGTTTAGIVSGGAGLLTVVPVAGHAYADEGVYTIGVTLIDDDPGTASIFQAGMLDVGEADTPVGTGLTIAPFETTSFTGAAATFSNAGFPDNTASDFTATIDWGDGTTDTGAAVTITGGSGSDLTVSGSHTYAEDGSYTTSITLTDDAPGTATATATGTANVGESDFALSTVAPISITEGQTFSGTVATFTDGFGLDGASAFSASIDWGDGTVTSGTVTQVGRLGGLFAVTGTHTYTDELNGNITVTASEPSANFTISNSGSITVAEADSLSGTPALVLVPIEGMQFSGDLAIFSDTGFPGNTAGDFTATIDWGDGTTDTGATVTITGGSGVFTVSGTHTYADEGDFGVAVTLTDDSPGTASATLNRDIPVIDADRLVGTGLTISAFETPNSFTGAVATFTDTTYPNNNPADFTATIDWGDGTTDTGAAVTIAGGSGNFTVSGTHSYAEDGSYTTSVTLTDDPPGVFTATATGVANVGESALGVTGVPVHTTEGVQFSGVLATATDPGSPDPASDFGAAIDWGDGTTDTGTVTGSAGNYTISGTHIYSDEGSFTATVTFFETNSPTFTVSNGSPVTVDEADVLSGTASSINTTEGTSFSGQVATFNDSGYPGNTASDFTATIDWGDGTTDTGAAVTITGGSGSDLTVSGSHTYTDEGTFRSIVTLTDDAPGTASETVITSATVAEEDALTGTGLTETATEGTSFSGAVATFTNTGFPDNTAGDFTATIDWGDGTTDTGAAVTVTGGSGSHLTVSGSHTYADEGSFAPIVTLTDNAPGTASATATGAVTVVEGDVLDVAVSQPTVSVAEADGSTTLNVAVFANIGYPTNPASDFTATIDWGDGTTTAGTATGDGAGNYTVSGTHAYADEGSFTARVTLSDDAPGTATVTVNNQVTVTEADTLIPSATSVAGTEGFLFSGQVASFTDIGYPANSASDFTATIDWGDNTTSTGTVSGTGGTFAVTGDHFYTASGHFTVSVKLIDDAPGTATATATTTATIEEQLLAAGTGAGQEPLVHVYDAVTGNLIATFDAFDPAFQGGVRVAVGDVNGDGVPDIIVAAGPGGGPHVKVIDGTKLDQVGSNGEILDSALLGSFFAYDPNFSGGVYVAFGISEGTPEIVTGAGPGGSPHVKVIDATKLNQLQSNSVIADSALVAQFYAYSPFFNGGVRVAAADLNGDRVLDIVTGAGPGGGPHVKAIDGDSLSDLDNNAEISNNALIGQFYAYTPTSAPSGGVFVAATDIGGNPIIITGDGSQADGAIDGPLVKVIDATKLNMLDSNSEPTGAALLGKFFAYDPAFQGGVTVGAAEINGDTAADVITGAGPGGGPHVKVIDGNQLNNLQPNMEIADAAVLDSFYAFNATFIGGVFIGAGT